MALHKEQREDALKLLAEGRDRNFIARRLGLTPGQVSAIAAHVTMGSYDKRAVRREASSGAGKRASEALLENEQRPHRQSKDTPTTTGHFYQNNPDQTPILIGRGRDTESDVFWNPFPDTGAANPHVLVLGESGFGKTYAIACLLGELAQKGIHSIVFDYGQGFTPATLPSEFVQAANPIEIHASREGIDLNPLLLFPSDSHGPVNVAQRVADTFARVYPKIGVQQHAIIRQAVLEVLSDQGILPEARKTWSRELPAFEDLQQKLLSYAQGYGHVERKVATLAGSHISTIFVFNTFRCGGRKLLWPQMLALGLPRKNGHRSCVTH